MSGMFRNTSTYALPARTTHGLVVVRSVPTSEPMVSAMTHATIAVASVQPRPTKRYRRYLPVPPGSCLSRIPQSHLYMEKKRETSSVSRSLAGYLYAAGSPESVGLANAFLSESPIGTFRLMFFGGTGFLNHFS